MRSAAHGFTLIEVLIAGGLAGLIAVAAFAAVTNMQQASGTQIEATTTFSSGRLGLDMMLRDIRMAGDSNDLLNDFCIPAAQRHDNTLYACPAILEAHPWRIVLSMNNWTAPAGAAEIGINSPFVAGSTPPSRASRLSDLPENTIAYEFVPLLAVDPPMEGLRVRNPVGGAWAARAVVRGRIDRILNPFGFDATGALNVLPPQRSVLVENVVLDNAMKCNPANPENSTVAGACDARFDHTLFSYRLFARQGTINGLAAWATTSQFLLSPPVNFYNPSRPLTAIGVGAAQANLTFGGIPGVPDVRGLVTGAGPLPVGADLYVNPPPAGLDGMTRTALTLGTPFDPAVPNSLIRLIYDRQRIRSVRVAFKVYSGREDPLYSLGLDLDNKQAGSPPLAVGRGTSPMFQFESEAELKVFNARSTLVDL